MICPHCQREIPDGSECPLCGIVFEKVHQRKRPDGQPRPASAAPKAAPAPEAVSTARISLRRRIVLYEQLGQMLQAGLSVSESLSLAGRRSRGAEGWILDRIRGEIEQGSSFAGAAARHPGLFPDASRALLEAAESTGGLPGALLALASSAELHLELRRSLVRASVYPFVIFSLVFFLPKAYLVVAAGWGAFLEAALLPYLLSLVGLVALLWGLPRLLVLGLGRRRCYGLVRRLPIAGKLVAQGAALRFCRNLASALSAGLPLHTGLQLAARAAGDPIWEERIDKAERVIASGGALHEALAATGLVDEDLQLVIAAGERSGRLAEGLERHAQLARASLQHRLQVAVQVLAVGILLATYAFAVTSIKSEYDVILGGYQGKLEKALGGAGLSGGSGSGEALLEELGKRKREADANWDQLIKELGAEGEHVRRYRDMLDRLQQIPERAQESMR
ncbi:MAG: type II secretion system F family protein [Deltaproteobacteria bacterium]|nr:type II secretion system F family protein [Deltaproteobacteria bacterium]